MDIKLSAPMASCLDCGLTLFKKALYSCDHCPDKLRCMACVKEHAKKLKQTHVEIPSLFKRQ